MKISIKKLAMELSSYTGTNNYILRNVTKVHKYEDGQSKDDIDYIKYSVVNPKTLENFDVKVANVQPVISQDEIDESEERFWISFTDAYIHPYRIEYGSAIASVKALSAKLVDRPEDFIL